MKKFLLYFVIFILAPSFTTTANAQTDTVHMKIMNISMGEKYESFKVKIQQKGFKENGMMEDGSALNGKFFDDRVNLSIVRSPVSDVVSEIFIMFYGDLRFEPVCQKYLNYIDALSEKYGKPTDLSDSGSYEPLNKNYKSDLDILKKDGKEYFTSWILPEGGIELAITDRYVLCLTYFDRINLDIHTKELKQIINETF